MARKVSLVVSLVVLAMVSVCPSWAQDEKEPVALLVTSKLGVKTKVKVNGVANSLGLIGQRLSAEPMAIDLGHGLYIFVPLRQVKHVANSAKESIVTMSDGSTHKGKIRSKLATDPALDDSDNTGKYPPSKAAEITNLSPSKAKEHDPERKRFKLKVAENVPGKAHLAARTFDVYAPGVTGDKVMFTMIVGGEEFEVNPVNFERIIVARKGKEWTITVKAPEAQERTGVLKTTRVALEIETLSGICVLLPLVDLGDEYTETHGFILERHQTTGK